MKLIFESWKRFINESKDWEAEKLPKKARGKTVYRVRHVSGITIPVQFYEGSTKNVKALVKFLNDKKIEGDFTSKNQEDVKKAVEKVIDIIIDSKYKNPNYSYKKSDEK